MSGFSDQEVERSRRYHRPRYVALVLDLLVTLAVLAALTRARLSLDALEAPLVVGALLGLVGLPVAWWRYRQDRTWGFATEPARSWAVDRVKEIAIQAVL